MKTCLILVTSLLCEIYGYVGTHARVKLSTATFALFAHRSTNDLTVLGTEVLEAVTPGAVENYSTSATSTSYNSTTMRTVVEMVSNFAEVWAELEHRGESVRIAIASKVERDIRITVGAGRYIVRRATTDTRLLLSAVNNPLRLLPSTAFNRKDSQLQLLDSFAHLSTADRVDRKRSLEGISEMLKELPPLSVYRTVTVLPNKLKYDFQRRKRTKALQATNVGNNVFSQLPGQIQSFKQMYGPSNVQYRPKRALSASERTERTKLDVYTAAGGNIPSVLAPYRGGQVTVLTPGCSDTGYAQTSTSSQNALTDAKNSSQHAALSYPKARTGAVVIETTAESTDTWEALLISSIFVSLDIALFLLETMLMATIPVVRDGGAQILARISDTFYLEDKLRNVMEAGTKSMWDLRGWNFVFTQSRSVQESGQAKTQWWREYPHFKGR